MARIPILGGTVIYNGATLITGNNRALGTGPVALTGGTLELGGAARTLAISYLEAFSFSTLALRVNDQGSDTVNVAGAAFLAPAEGFLGATLSLNFTGLQPVPGARGHTADYTLLTSAGLQGTEFANITTTALPVNSTYAVDYTNDDTDVEIVLTTSATIYPKAGLNKNQQVLVSGINRALLANNNSDAFDTVNLALSNNFAANSKNFAPDLNELSPEKFSYFTSQTAFNNASFETEAMDGYLAGARTGPQGTFASGDGAIDASGLTVNDPDYDPSLSMVHSRLLAWNLAPFSGAISDVADPLLGAVDMKAVDEKQPVTTAELTDPWHVFVRGSVILAQGFSQTNVPHFDDNTASVVLGADYRLTPSFLVGLTTGYAHTDVTLDHVGSSATVDSYSPGLYASYANHGWYANLSGSYLHNAYTQSRVIGFLGQTATSAPEGNEGVANVDGGYDFHFGSLTCGPLAGIQYTHLSVDGYSESGSAANLVVNDDESDSLRSRLGGSISYAFSKRGVVITPHLDASWQHEFLDQDRGISSQFGFGGGSFKLRVPYPDRDSALVDAGTSADLNRMVSLFADYMIQAGQGNYFGQSVQAGVKLAF